jgi:hypothetical protein
VPGSILYSPLVSAGTATVQSGGSIAYTVMAQEMVVTVTVNHAAAAGYSVRVKPSCTDPNMPTNGYLLAGTTNSSGQIVVAMPFGAWTVAAYPSASATTPVGATAAVSVVYNPLLPTSAAVGS